MEARKLKSYASYFASFLLDNMKETGEIENIILFGGVARNQGKKESDIDIFIELKKKNDKLEKNIREMVDEFYKSREGILFKSRGVDNKINLKIGRLKEWKDLENPINSDGILLYGKYHARNIPSDVKHYIIVAWSNIGKNRGAFLNKLYGFKVNGKAYEGLINKFSGKKLGKSSIMIPIQYKNEIFKLLKEYDVTASNFEVYV